MTYDALLEEGLGYVSDGVLKTEGSLVYNAISLLAFELERLYIQADYMLEQIDPETATYDNLVKLCAQRGIYPESGTCVEVAVVGNAPIPIGSRFSLSAYTYVVTAVIDAATFTYRAQCETAGSGPNGLTGTVTMITYVEDLTTAAVTEVLVAGDDASTQAELLAAYKASFNSSAYGGNVADYKAKINSFDGISGCKIYPVWNGGGTVKAVLIGSDYGVVSETLVAEIQEEMCATPSTGYGIAPIGHDATIVSVSSVPVNIVTNITFATGYSWADSGADIRIALEDYLLGLRETWSSGDVNTYITVYVSRVESAILSVEGVLDVSGTTLNGSASNLVLSWDAIPAMGTVNNS